MEDVKSWSIEHGFFTGDVIADARTVTRSLPRNYDVSEVTTEFFRKHEVFTTHERFVSRIPKASVVGDRGFVVLPDGRFANEYVTGHLPFITEHPLYHKRFQLRRRLRKTQLHGDYIAIHGSYARNFYHWMHDILLQFHLLDEYLPSSVKFILPGPLMEYQWITLDLLGIDRDRVIEHECQDRFEVENLWFIPPATYTGFDEKHSLDWLRTTLTNSLGLETQKESRRLYVSRAKANYRRISNESEFLQKLDAAGFEFMISEDLSIQDQLRLFHEADTVMAPHGAGLVNSFMMKPGGRMIELFPESMLRHCYWSMATACGLQYSFATGQGFEESLETDYSMPSKIDEILTEFSTK